MDLKTPTDRCMDGPNWIHVTQKLAAFLGQTTYPLSSVKAILFPSQDMFAFPIGKPNKGLQENISKVILTMTKVGRMMELKRKWWDDEFMQIVMVILEIRNVIILRA